MKTKLFILSLTALVFSTICNAQEHYLLEKQIDTAQTDLVVQVDPPDSTYWMVSPNPPYIIDSNIVVEPQIAVCGGVFPFVPDSMNIKYPSIDTVEFNLSKDKFNAPYYYFQIATDSNFNNIVYSANSLLENKLVITKLKYSVYFSFDIEDTATHIYYPKEKFWRVGVDTQGWGLNFNEPNGQNITWSNTDRFTSSLVFRCFPPDFFPPDTCKSTPLENGLAYPNPSTDIINVSALQGDLIELLDANGSVLVTAYSSEVSTNVINISQLKSGSYFLKITSVGDVKTSRIIKQ